MIYLLLIVISIVSVVVQTSLQSKFTRYSQIPLDSAMSGGEVAQRMLREHGLGNVRVTSTSGSLTDYYNPANQTVNLSDTVYCVNSIAAAAVAAHECGHAVQHATGYAALRFRTSMVPVVSIASKWTPWVILAGVMLIQVFPVLLMIGIAMFGLTTLFSFVTLPVEIDASRRAVAWLEQSGIAHGEKLAQAREALRLAAYTYVVAAVGSLMTLLYYLSMLSRRN